MRTIQSKAPLRQLTVQGVNMLSKEITMSWGVKNSYYSQKRPHIKTNRVTRKDTAVIIVIYELAECYRFKQLDHIAVMDAAW